MIDTLPDPGTGAVLDGRYRLQEMLGRGGMGRVYRAEHIGLNRPVAIKVLDPNLVGDDEARRRFEREAQATARLRHPNCVAVTDFGTMADGSLFLAMELVDGRTLDDLLGAEERLAVPRALHVFRHVLRGLAHAHAQGLVHRDLKPCNIMLVREGMDPDFAKILDFGLARLVGGDADKITRTGIVCGTPRYMAPEQAQDRGFDPRTDLYAASVILFEMLTGRTPFESDEAMKILAMHLKDPVPRIAEVAPTAVVAPAIEAVIRRGLAKRPDDRPASAEAYLAELDAAIGGGATIELSGSLASVVVAPGGSAPTVPARPRRLTPPQRRLAIGGAVIAALLLVGVIAAVAGGGDEPAPSTPSAVAAAPVEPAAELELEADTAEPTSSDAALERAVALLRAGRAQEAVDRLKKLRAQRPDDAGVAYLLGRAYERLNWPKQTIESYRDAIELDPGKREDPQLIRGLVGLLDSKSAWQQAARALEQDVGTPALPVLEETAKHHGDAIVRSRAKKIAAKITSQAG